MVNPEVLEHLSGGIKRGLELEEVKQQLLSRGYSDYDINHAMKEFSPGEKGKKSKVEEDSKDESKNESKDESIEGWDEILD